MIGPRSRLPGVSEEFRLQASGASGIAASGSYTARMNPRHFLLATLLLLPAVLGLGGCGNKGQLVRPGAAPHAQPAPAATSAMPSHPAIAATASPRG